MSNKKLSRYKSKQANEKHANLMISLGEKIAWAIFAIPITFLAKYEGASSLEKDWLLTFIMVAGIMSTVSILLQKSGFGILDEINAKELK